LYEVLLRGEDERLQVLTHPEFWQEEVMSPKERIARCADGRAEKAKQWYDQVVRAYGRENVDW
jgi:hypothetical protein